MICLAGFVVLLLAVTAEARVGHSSEPSSFCTETNECLLFDLICEGDNYEVRHYEATKWVTTKVKSVFRDVAGMRAFRKLFKYISGENEAGVKINMTAPVLVKVNESASLMEKSVYEMSFLLPSIYQTDAPNPTDSTVYFTDMPEINVYVKSFGGWLVSLTSTIVSGKLKDELNAVEASYVEDYHYDVGYNSPMKLLNRHNEVWYVVEGQPVCQPSE